MGFFKGIKRFVKRNARIKNVVKFAGQTLSNAPGVGSLVGGAILEAQENHYQKKAARQEKRQAEAEAAADLKFAKTEELGRTLGSQIAGSLGNSAAEGFAGRVGQRVVDNTIKEWFRAHWKKLALGAAALVGVVMIVKRSNRPQMRKTWR